MKKLCLKALTPLSVVVVFGCGSPSVEKPKISEAAVLLAATTDKYTKMKSYEGSWDWKLTDGGITKTMTRNFAFKSPNLYNLTIKSEEGATVMAMCDGKKGYVLNSQLSEYTSAPDDIPDAMESPLDYLKNNSEIDPLFVKRLPKSLGNVQQKLSIVLEKRQVSRIDIQGDKPDFTYCQVVDREERDDLEDQTITKVVRQGFRLGDKVLRPVEVITAKSKNV